MTNLVLGGAAAYGLGIGGLYLMQEALLFPRSAAATPSYPLPDGTERLQLTSADGDQLVGNLVPGRHASRGLLLAFGGNAWNGDDLTAFLAHRLHDVDIAVFHYRGYAPSEGKPSEPALYADALLVHDHLVDRLHPPRVVAAGLSLGSAVAAYLASRRPISGIVLVTPFDSIEAIARMRYPWAPVSKLLRHPFRTDSHLRDLDLPVAVILAGEDKVVPPERSRALIQLLRRPVLERTITGGSHNGLYERPAIDEALREALDAVIASAGAPGDAGGERAAPEPA